MQDQSPRLHQTSASRELDDLGPVLWKRPLDAKAIVVALGLALIVSAYLYTTRKKGVSDVVFAAMVAAPVLVVGLWYYWREFARQYYLHERGVRETQFGRVSTIRYSDVGELTFKQERRYHAGVYYITEFALSLRSIDPQSRAIKTTWRVKENTGLATDYRESTIAGQVAQSIARRMANSMAAAVARGESVDWTRGMHISSSGIELPGKASPQRVIAWDEITSADFYENTSAFCVKVAGSSRHAIEVRSHSANFWPGYYLIVARLANANAEPS